MKTLYINLLFIIIVSVGIQHAQSLPDAKNQKPNKSENSEAYALAAEFIIRFANDGNLKRSVRDLFVSDFIERYIEAQKKLSDLNSDKVFFLPGIVYNARLLNVRNSSDWKKFYIASHTFLLLGTISAIKKGLFDSDKVEITPNDLYPSDVINLVNSNPNLANFIQRKTNDRPISSFEEMRVASSTLERAIGMITKNPKPKKNATKMELVEFQRQEDFFKPQLIIHDEEYFGFPKNTRMLLINSVIIGYQLMLVRDGGQLRIFQITLIFD